jgi:hypothetical protein
MGAQAEEFLNSLAVPPAAKEGELLVVTSDGKGVPMVQADAQRLRCFEERPTRPGNRRMATLAGVYSVDRHVRTPEQIVAALFRDVREEPVPSDDARPEPRHKRIIGVLPAGVHEPFWGILYPGCLRILGGWPWVERIVAGCRRSWPGHVIGSCRGVEHASRSRGSRSRCGRWPLS